MLKRIILLLVTLGIGGLISCMCYAVSAADHVVINEVCSNNFSALYDANEKSPDYIELYNPSWMPVSLSGYSLSDSADELKKCNLDSVILAPKSYMLIYADGFSDTVIGHTSFEVSRQGDTVYLSNSQGEIIDSVNVPMLDYDSSYARTADGGKEWERKIPTPGTANENAEIVVRPELEKPRFSHESGFYEEAFTLELIADEGEDIYYTLDGSEPDVNSKRYDEKILIVDASESENVYSSRKDLSIENHYTPNYKVDKATVVRAIAYNESTGQISEIGTRTYFVDFDHKDIYDDVPIISIVTDPDNLFDFDKGIYANGAEYDDYLNSGGLQNGEILESYVDESGQTRNLYSASNAFNSGKDWEREARFIYFDNMHECKLEQNVGIRISGQSSRKFPQKSFNIFARDIYDDDNMISYDFWGKRYKCSSIKLRNGGSNNGGSKIKDPFIHDIVKERNVSVQDSEPCVVFLNGEYWGVYNIRERFKEEYFSNHFDLATEDILMMDAGRIAYGSYDAWNEYTELVEYIEQHDLTDDDNYAVVCEMLDVQSLIDFYCINIYVDNQDVSFDKNIAMWKSKKSGESNYQDGKWRMMLYDVDLALFDYKNNSFTESISWKEIGLIEDAPMDKLLQNERFKKQFCLTFMDMINETFDYEKVGQELDAWNDCYEELVIEDQRRFYGNDGISYVQDIAHMDEFFALRGDYMMQYLGESLSLRGTVETVDLETNQPAGGKVMLNTLELVLDNAWSGEYYTDYPITVSAVAEEGYRFAGWSGDVQSKEQRMTLEIPEGGLSLCAEFEKID